MLLSSRIASSKKIPSLLLCKCHTMSVNATPYVRPKMAKIDTHSPKRLKTHTLWAAHIARKPPPPGKIIAIFRIKFQLN